MEEKFKNSDETFQAFYPKKKRPKTGKSHKCDNFKNDVHKASCQKHLRSRKLEEISKKISSYFFDETNKTKPKQFIMLNF